MPDTSLIGQTLSGRFRITGVIGEGGMATVYRALDQSSKAFAVKIMNPELAKESRFVRRFRREAKAAALLKHPNTVQIAEFGVDEKERVFMVMELLEGYDLAMLLHRERRIPEARAVQIVIQVCKALSAAHEQSIVHRDLKPDNIMLIRKPDNETSPVPNLSPTDFVKVLDFGIAKILDDDPSAPMDPRMDPITQEKSMLTRVGTIVGTPAYMAPEQGRAEAVDARTDIYACGVLLYELISGRVPFTGETPMQVVMRHVNEPPRPPSDHLPVSECIEKIIMRALAKFPAQRQQSAEELAFDLLGVLPKLEQPATKKESELSKVNKTLVMEPPAPAPAPRAAPRPAAGVPAKPAPPKAPAKPSRPEPAMAAPFPTLNIEVPDDLLPASALLEASSGAAGAASTQAASTAAVSTAAASTAAASSQAETQRLAENPLNSTAVSELAPELLATPTPVKEIPVLRPGQAPGQVAALGSTMNSVAETANNGAKKLDLSIDSVGGAGDEEEEAPTVLKEPSPIDKARMSFAEEAMARALAGPAVAQAPRAAPQVSAQPEAPAASDELGPTSGPDSAQPTLVTAVSPSPAPPAPLPGSASSSEGPARVELSGLESTVRVDPEEFAMPEPPPVVPTGDSSGPIRKPTGELAPVVLASEDRPSLKPGADSAALWQPKKKSKQAKLSGAMALILGIGIGALLVAAALTVAILLRAP